MSRDERERAEAEAQNQAKAELRGFGSLLGAKRATSQNLKVGGMFSRLLGGEDEDASGSIGGVSETGTGHGGATSIETPDGPTADGSVIKVKGTVGKKRGLYTSCMKKPVVPEDVIAAANAGTDHSASGVSRTEASHQQSASAPASGASHQPSASAPASGASHQQSANAPAVGSQHGPSHVVPQVPVRGNFSHSEHVHEKSFPLYDAATTSKGVSFNNRAARSEVEESSDGPDESFPAPNITNVPLPHVRSAAASAREFEMPTVPDQAKQEGKDFSTLRKLANDGKGSKVIPSRPASAGARNGRFAADTEAHESPESSQGSSVSPKTGIVGKLFGALKKLFGGK
ncbi:MAG: hypothetical protein IPK73_14155 [Candidatus Obscuribacter sp.]|nr:hypothetical protein [Candidatus Obscuribacter sp.]